MNLLKGLVLFLLSFLSGVCFIGVVFFFIAAFTTGNFAFLYFSLACVVGTVGTYAGADDFFPKL